ncbi:MAG: hypothetical protein H8E35_12830 [Ardenticatenia bacterium]|nr:hypothetical protein [Ardenticatenia bacterium]
MKKQRSLTIRDAAGRADSYLLRRGEATSRPAIRLQGKWLALPRLRAGRDAEAGFEAGQKVTVHVDDGQIVITPPKARSCQTE